MHKTRYQVAKTSEESRLKQAGRGRDRDRQHHTLTEESSGQGLLKQPKKLAEQTVWGAAPRDGGTQFWFSKTGVAAAR